MSSTDALTGAVIVAVVGAVIAYAISLSGRLLNILLLGARVWRMAARHPRAPNKRFPWGTMLGVVLGGAVFWTSMAIALVLGAESALALAKQWSIAMPIASLAPLDDRWLLVYGLFFLGFVVAFSIPSPVAWRRWKRERDWRRTLRRGLKRLIAETTVPPEREREWQHAQRDALESMTELPLEKFVSRDLLKEFAATITAKGYFCFSARHFDDPEPSPSLWQRWARRFVRRRPARR
jgi:hypothetical protein